MSIAYGFNEEGYFTGIIPMQRNPFRKEEFLLPASSTLVEPPTGYTEDQQPMFNQVLQTWELAESEYKKSLDAEKLGLVNEKGVSLYEEDETGAVVLRSEEEVLQETTAIEQVEQVGAAQNVMNENIISKALEITGASNTESAGAFFQGYSLRAANAAEYAGEGLVAHYSHGNYSLGDALDTEAKIVEYYTALNILMDKFRNSEINTYLAAKEAITAS